MKYFEQFEGNNPSLLVLLYVEVSFISIMEFQFTSKYILVSSQGKDRIPCTLTSG